MADFIWILILLFFVVFSFFIGQYLGKLLAKNEFNKKIPKLRKEAVEQSRAVLTGKFSEQISPYLPDFPYNPAEAKFLGSPIDLIVFKGMNDKNINEVVFIEVKSGKSSLNKQERNLRDAIKNKKVSWYEYRVPN